MNETVHVIIRRHIGEPLHLYHITIKGLRKTLNKAVASNNVASVVLTKAARL